MCRERGSPVWENLAGSSEVCFGCPLTGQGRQAEPVGRKLKKAAEKLEGKPRFSSLIKESESRRRAWSINAVHSSASFNHSKI